MVLQSLKRLFRQGIAATTSLSLAFAPAVANAQQAAPSIVIDNRTNPSAPAPNLDRTANGVQQLNIATPNGAGLSHNMFTQYGVEQKGLILNNATKATQTQLGGYVYGNANLHGKAAHVILNEVTGTQASQMLGYTEVAGQKANVVVANPNGITCNGCGFINTDRVSLATGHPEIDASGKLSALTVSDGLIAFEGRGGDFTAVPVLDILSRRVTLDAKVNAQTARLVAGRNRFDYETGTAHALKSDGSKTPEFAIDSTALGGMYAGQISMVVNEAGAGVRANGTMAANAGDMTLTADGRLVLNGSMTATGNVSVQAGGVQNAGTLQSGADTRIASTADVSNTGIVSAGQALSISGSSLTNTGTMTAAGQAGASFASSGAFSNSGQIGATQGGVSVRAGSVTTALGSRLVSVRNMAIQTDGSFSHAGEVSTSDGTLTLSAGNVTVSGGKLASTGTLRATASSWISSAGSILKSGDALSLGVSGPVSNDGVISAVTGVSLTSAGNVTNGAPGSITAQSGPLVLSAPGRAVTNAGQIETVSVGDLTVSAASLDNTGTVYGSGAGTLALSGALRNVGGQFGSGMGPLVLTALTIDNTAGKIISAVASATLRAGTIANSRGVIQAAGDLMLSAASLDNRAGGTVLSTGGALTLTHGQAPMGSVLNQGGSLGAAESLSLNTSDYASDATSSLASSGVLTLVMTGTLDNAGQLIGEQGFVLTVGALKNESSGLVAARQGNGRLTVTGRGGLINAGTIETLATGSQLTVASAGELANSGLLAGVGSVALSADAAVTNRGTLSAQGGNLSLETATLANNGSLAALSGLTVTATSGVTNDQNGQIAVQSGSLSLTAGGSGLSNAGQIGTVDAGDLTVSATSLTNTGAIGAAGSGTITADGAIDNSGSLQVAGQTLIVAAQDVSNSGTLAATAGDLSVKNAGVLTNDGTLYGAASDSLTVSSALDNRSGQIGSGTGSLTLAAGSLTNGAGKIIAASGPVGLNVDGLLDNRSGTIQGQGDVSLSAASLDNRASGTIVSQSGVLRLSDGTGPMSSVLNQGGTLGAAGSVSLNTQAYGSDATSALISTDVLTLTMTGALENEGRLVGQKGFAITAGSFRNGSGGVLAAVTGDGTLTTTASGGVTNAGTIETLASDSVLTVKSNNGFANGGSVLSGGAVSLSATGSVTNSGRLSALGGDLTLSAATFGNNGTVAASGSTDLTTAGDIADTGVLYAGDALTLTAGNALSVTGSAAQAGAGRGDVALRAASLSLTDGKIISAAGHVSVAAGAVRNDGGILQGGTDLQLMTDQLTNTNRGVLLAENGALGIAGLSSEAAGTVSNTGGTLQGNTGVMVHATSMDNTGGTVLSRNGPMTLVSDGLLNNSSGIIQSATGLSLVVGSYSSDVGAVLSTGGTLSASVSGQMDNAGHVIAAGDLDLTTGSLVTQSAPTPADISVLASTGGTLTVHAGSVVNAGALEATGAGGSVRLTADQINNTGALSAVGDLTVSDTGSLTSSGTMLAQKGNAAISAASVTNRGFAGGAASLSVAAHDSLMNSGTLFSGDVLTARSGGMLGNGGGQMGGSVIDLTASGVLDNSAGTVIASAGDLALKAGQVTNGPGGVLQSSGSVTLTTDTLQNAGGTVLAKAGDLSVLSPEGVAGAVDNSTGTLQAGGAIILPFSTLNNAGGSILALGNSLTLAGTTGSVVANANGKIESNGTLSLTAGRYTTQEPVSDATLPAGRLAATGDMTLMLSDQVQNSGVIAAGRSLTLTADSAANDVGGVIASTAGNLALNLSGATGLDNAGTIQSTGAGATLKIGTQSLGNTATGGILSNGAQILSVSGALGNAGEITAYGNPLTVNAGSVANRNLLLAGSDLTLSTPGNLTNTGLVYGKRNAVLSADLLDNRGGQIGAGEGGLTVAASSLDNSQNGRLIATDGAVTITSGPVANDNGLIESGSDLALYMTGLTNSGGKVLSDRGNVILAGRASGESAGTIINDTGVLQAAESLTVIADTLSNRSGTVLTQNGDLSLSAPNGAALQSVDDTGGMVQSGRDLALNSQALTGATGLSADRDMSVTLGSGISDPMLFSAGRDMTLTLNGDYSIPAGSGVIAGGDAHISASSVNNAGAMMAGGTLSVRTPGAISNTGLLDGTGGLSLALDGALSNVQGAILSDVGGIEIGGLSRPYAGDVLNRSGEIMAGSAAGDVVIRARSLTNDILGGVTTTSNQVVYDQKYTVGTDALAMPPALNPSLANYGAINQYYNHVMKIFVPELWYSATGQKGTGYYLVALDGASASSFVEVTGTGSSATAQNAGALISAGRNLVVETTGDILNDASHIAAGQDIALTGASLTNKGYDTEIVWSLTENSPHLKRWFTPSDGSQFVTPDPAASSNSAGNPGWMTLNGGPHTTQWGSSTYTGLSGSIVAGGNLTGSFTGQLNNTTVVAHAAPGLLASANAYSGTTPGSVSPSGSVAAASGGGLVVPGSAGSFAQASTATSSGTTGAGAVSGGQLASQTGTTATGQASAVSGGTLEGISAGSTQAVSTQAGGGAMTSVPAGSSIAAPVYGNVLPPEGHESGATTAQNLALPGFTGAAAASVSQVMSSVPAGKALYVPNSSPDAHVLIETNPAYTSLTAFHGSEYLLDRLGDQPQDYTFLGDSAFDQQYVQQQIVSATGQTFLGGTYNTASSQMQALLDNAVSESNQLGLSIGQGLSSAQQAALTSDIVWYQNEVVDGKTVLVPKLYLAPGHEALTGASISGKNVSLTAASVTNSGSVSAQDALSITATSGDITNTGSLSGGTVSLTAQDGSILNNDTINTYLVQGGTQGQLASVGTITARGAASLSAAKDITFNGGVLTTGSDLSVLAGDGLTLGTTTVQQAAAVSGKSLSMGGSQTQNYGTTITSGGNATLAALGGDLKAAGATLTSEGATTLLAGKSLDLGAVTNSESDSISGRKSGFLTHSSFSNSQSSSTDVGTTVAAGKDLTAVSGGDMHVAGMVGGGSDVTLQSGGSFTESALHSASSEASSHHVAGLHLSTQGASGTVGYGSRTDTQSARSSTYTPSVIASTGGSLKIGANGPVTIDGSVVAAVKDLGISGSSVAFTTEQNSMTQTAMHKDKSIGVTGRVSPNSVVGQIINTALAATQTSGKGGATLATLDAMQGAYLAGTSIAKGLDTSPAGQDSGNIELVGVQAGVGLASNKRSVTQTETTVQGATATAGGTLSVVARGDNASDKNNGDLSAVAAQLAGQDVVLAAQKDMSLSAGWNSTDSESRMSSNNAFVGVDAGVGTSGAGVSVTASVGLQNQHVTTSSRTAVDTTVKAGNSVTLSTPGAMRLNGAEVSGPRVDVSAGSLSITSPQNTSDYKSTARQAGASISVPVWGAGGKTGGGASYSQQNVTDHFATTEDQLSGFYAGSKGLGVDVAGNTALTAGVLSSTAEASLNHFTTGSLTATDVENISRWDAKQTGGSFSAGAGMFGSTAGILGVVGSGLASGASGLMGGGRTHDETSVSQSAIGGNITVNAGSVSGSYTTDVETANAALTNKFDAQTLSNQLMAQQMGSQLVGEVGGQVADKLNDMGVAGFDETNWKDNFGRIALETAGNAVVAAVSGGNVGAAAAGTAAGGIAVSASLNSVAGWVLNQTDNNVETAAPLVTAIENIIASGAGAAGGFGGGGGKTASTNALNGAFQASAVEQYNAGAGDILKVVVALAKSRAAQVAKDALLNTLKGEGTTVAKGVEREAESAKNLEATAGDAGKEITRPTPRQSEKDVTNDIGENAREQVSYKDGEEVPYGTKGSSRIDVLDTATGESYEVKNYNIEKNSSGLISNVVKQIIQRASQLPKDTQQNVVIDVRGQSVSRETSMTIVRKIVEKSNGIISQENITFKGKLK